MTCPVDEGGSTVVGQGGLGEKKGGKSYVKVQAI